MKIKMKKTLALVLAFSMLLPTTSCGKAEGTGTLLGEAGTETGEMATETFKTLEEEAQNISKGDRITNENGNIVKLRNVKEKGTVFAPLAFVAVIVDIIVIIFGGVFTIPGWISTDKGYKFIDMKVKYTNKTDEKVIVGDAVTKCLAKVGDDYYNASVVYEASAGLSLEGYIYTKEIKAGRSKNLHFLIEVPEEALKEDTDIDIIFEIDGEVYLYHYQ